MAMHNVVGVKVTWRCAAALILSLMVLIALILARSRVYVHATVGPPSQHEREMLKFAQWFPGTIETEIEATKIAELNASLWENTGVLLDLVFVHSGVAQYDLECQEGVGTSTSRLHYRFFRYRMTPVLVLARANTKEGCFAVLKSLGGPRSGGKGPTRAPSEKPQVKMAYDRTITWPGKEIVYVEGSEVPIVFPGMSLKEFCERNSKGEYLVVVASLN